MDDRALQTAMQFAQRSNDTPTFLGLMAEANKRKKMRSEAQGMQAGQQMSSEPPVTIADKVMSGIANLSSGDHEYATGGIVSFAGGGGADDNTPSWWGAAPAAAYGSYRALLPTLKQLEAVTGTPLKQLAMEVGAETAAALRSAAPSAPASTLGKLGVVGALGQTALETATTPTEGYRARFGMDPKVQASNPETPGSVALLDPGFWRDAATRGLGAASDLGDVLTFGQASKLYRDKQASPETAPNKPAPNKPAATAKPAAAPAAAPGPAYGADFRGDRYLGGISPSSPPSAKTAAGSGEASVSASAKKATPAVPTVAPAEGGLPTLTPSAVEKTLTADEIKAKAKAMAAGDDEKVDAIYAKATERAEKRRAELEAETKPTTGLLGLSMSPEMRKVLRDAGIGAMTSKSTTALGGIGEGLSKAASEYDAGRMRRNEQAALLDAAEEKRGIAALAAKQGNMEAARKNIVEADALRQQAVGNALKRDEGAVARYKALMDPVVEREKMASHLQGIREQIAGQKAVAGMHTRMAAPQVQMVREIMSKNPGMTVEQALSTISRSTREMPSADAMAKLYETARLYNENTPPFNEWVRQFVGAYGGASGNIPAVSGKTGNPLVDKYLPK